MTDVLMQTKFATLFVYYSFAQKLIRQEQKLLKKLLKKLRVLVRKPCKRGRKKEGKHLKVLSPELLQKYSAREKRRSDCVRWRKPCPRLKCLELSYTHYFCVYCFIFCVSWVWVMVWLCGRMRWIFYSLGKIQGFWLSFWQILIR